MDKETTFATELLHELKLSHKRLFTAFIIVLILWFATIMFFIGYLCLPTEDISIDSKGGNANYIGNDLNGTLNNGNDRSELDGEDKNN